MTNKVMERIMILYLLTKIELCSLILLELNTFCKKILSKIKDLKSIIHNILRTQDNDSIMYGFCSNALIAYIFAGKVLLHFTKLFSPNDYKRNDKIILKCVKEKYGKP